MSPGLFKALLQTVNYFRNWRKRDPESATQRGRKYLFWILLSGGCYPVDSQPARDCRPG